MVSVILPIIIFPFFLKRNRERGYWVIFLCCLFSILADFGLAINASKPDRFFYIYSSFTITEYTLFALFLYLSYKDKRLKWVVIFCSLLFYLIAVINIAGKNKVSFDSVSASMESILIIIYSILFLYEQIRDPSVFYIYNQKKFWVILAFLLYFSSTLFLFIYAATFERPDQSVYWTINNVFDIIKNVLFTISFIVKENKKQPNPLENLYPDI